MSPTATLVGSEALSTAFSPLTPVAPPADVLMLSQPAPSGSHLTAGMIGVGAAAGAAARGRRSEAPRRWCRHRVRAGKCGCALGPAVGLAVAVTRLRS